jgi:hypothetical protein
MSRATITAQVVRVEAPVDLLGGRGNDGIPQLDVNHSLLGLGVLDTRIVIAAR